jgi:hypothetical protein
MLWEGNEEELEKELERMLVSVACIKKKIKWKRWNEMVVYLYITIHWLNKGQNIVTDSAQR